MKPLHAAFSSLQNPRVPSRRKPCLFRVPHPVQTRKLICQIYFTPATFRGSAYLISMSAKTLPVTAGSFERVFAGIATERTLGRRSRSGKIAKYLADWREIAWAALERKKLGDTLRRAIATLSGKYRER